MESRGRKFLKFVIWTVILIPVGAGVFDIAMGALALDRGARGQMALRIGQGLFAWLSMPSTLLLLHKFAMSFVRTMPAPPANCTFICRWLYDAAQDYFSNEDLKGKSSPPKSAPTGSTAKENTPA